MEIFLPKENIVSVVSTSKFSVQIYSIRTMRLRSLEGSLGVVVGATTVWA
jgi:hypothetical protein